MGRGSEKGKVEWFVSLLKTKLTLIIISIRNKRQRGVRFKVFYFLE